MSTLTVANLDVTNLSATVGLGMGNTTVNVIANSTILQMRNTTTTTNTSAAGLVVGTCAINSTAVVSGGATVLTLSGTDQVITGGSRITVLDLGNSSGRTITPDPGDRPHQKVTNNGAWTLAPGTNNGNYILDIINTTGAAIPTTSGWTKVAGDDLTATTTDKFRCGCSITADASLLSVQALQ